MICNQKVGLFTPPVNRLFSFVLIFSGVRISLKKEDIHLKPHTLGEVARFTVTERAVCGGRTVVSNTTPIQNAGDYNPSVA